MYYYSTIRLILIYRPSEGGRLSRPRHCSKCAACAQSCVSQWFSWKHKLLSAARFEPGPSRAAGKRVTTIPLRPKTGRWALRLFSCGTMARLCIVLMCIHCICMWVSVKRSKVCAQICTMLCGHWSYTSTISRHSPSCAVYSRSFMHVLTLNFTTIVTKAVILYPRLFFDCLLIIRKEFFDHRMYVYCSCSVVCFLIH